MSTSSIADLSPKNCRLSGNIGKIVDEQGNVSHFHEVTMGLILV